MKYLFVSVLSIIIAVCASYAKPGDSLLTPTAFPKTTDDLTFKQRMELLAAGYEPFDTVFDSNGVCIKNCPYVGITVKDFEKRIEQAAEKVQQDLANIKPKPDVSDTQIQPQVPYPNIQPDKPLDNTKPQPAIPRTQQLNSSELPVTCPVGVEPVRVTSEWKWRKKNIRYHHGVDMGIVIGTPVYAAANGTVVIRKNEGNKKGYGNYLVIQHPNGYYTVYGHLSQWLVNQGDTVTAGQQIAKSGNTGASTGPHLHFEVLTGAPLARLGATSVNPRTITRCPWSPKNNSVNANPKQH